LGCFSAGIIVSETAAPGRRWLRQPPDPVAFEFTDAGLIMYLTATGLCKPGRIAEVRVADAQLATHRR